MIDHDDPDDPYDHDDHVAVAVALSSLSSLSSPFVGAYLRSFPNFFLSYILVLGAVENTIFISVAFVKK